MRVLMLMLAAFLVLGACADKKTRQYFDGKYYPTKAKKVKGDRESFVVNVRKASRGLNGARQAGEHAAAKYCIETFGYSGLDWQVGPDSTEAATQSAKGNLVLRGRCQVWE